MYGPDLETLWMCFVMGALAGGRKTDQEAIRSADELLAAYKKRFPPPEQKAQEG